MRAVRDGASKKPSGSARYELEQLCCYVNPDFSVKMSDVSEHSDSGKKGKARWSQDKMLIAGVRSGRTASSERHGYQSFRTHGSFVPNPLDDSYPTNYVLGPNIFPSDPPTQSISTY